MGTLEGAQGAQMAQGVDAGMFVRDYHPRAERAHALERTHAPERARPQGPSERPEPTLVYLHDLGEQGLTFEAVATHPRLSSVRHLVPDLPGHGRSRPAARPTPLEAFADHFARWLVERTVEKTGDGVVLVGHGLGGVIAMLVAERHPAITRAVVDIDGPKCADDAAKLRVALAEPPARAAARPCDPRVFRAWARELLDLVGEGSLASRLGALSVPTLFVTETRGGASDSSFTLLREAHVVVAELPDGDPRPAIKRPDELAGVLSDLPPCSRRSQRLMFQHAAPR